jgi:hypothetical protein
VASVVIAAGLRVWLDDGQRLTEILVAVGLIATVVAIAVLLGTAQGWANGAQLSLAAVTTAVVGMGALALAVVTYVGMGDDGLSGGTPGDRGSVSTAPADASDEGEALTQQRSNNDVQPPGYAHDVGGHPAFADFMSADRATLLAGVPGGTLLPTEVDLLRDQLAAARKFAEQYDTVEKAEAAGFFNTTNDVPFMGAHFISRQNLMDGVFDAGKPEGLLFSKLGGGDDAPWRLVGVWYLLVPGINPGVTDTTPPEGFAGNLDLWHAHRGLCTRAGTISENNSAESCSADNGNFIGDLRWMMHVWVWPEGANNPEGVFTYLNQNLYDMQQNVRAQP